MYNRCLKILNITYKIKSVMVFVRPVLMLFPPYIASSFKNHRPYTIQFFHRIHLQTAVDISNLSTEWLVSWCTNKIADPREHDTNLLGYGTRLAYQWAIVPLIATRPTLLLRCSTLSSSEQNILQNIGNV